MKPTFKFLFPVCLLLLSGCAQIVTKNYAGTRGGTVKYNSGWFMAEKNREKAMQEIAGFCSGYGRPQILREDSKLEFTGRSYTDGSVDKKSYSSTTTEGRDSNVYIQFRCMKVARR